MRFETYRTSSRHLDGWAVIELDGSEDGRWVCGQMIEEDAVRIARLLNEDSIVSGKPHANPSNNMKQK